MFRLRLIAAALSAASLLCAPGAFAASDHKPRLAADKPAADARRETVGGVLEALTVYDSRHGASARYFSLRDASGKRVGVKWLGAADAVPGATVQVEGRRSDGTLFVDRSHTVAGPAASFRDGLPAGARRYTGTLEVLHVDDPENDRCELRYVLRNEAGTHLQMDLPVVPDMLEEGMALTVDGVATADGLAIEPAAITIEGDTAPEAAADVSGTTQVLVILLKYADTTTEPYTQAGITSTVFSAAGSVANYFAEASYGKHRLAGTVTPWLKASFAKPTTCDYSRVSTEAMNLARAAGYNTAAYQKYVYVFPALPGCGWAGLGGGSQAWINQAASVLVIGHELGHTFGLGHASSLRCTQNGATTVADGTCSRSEYGDGNDVMGNSRAGHFNASFKAVLGYLGSTQYQVHRGGTATYTLSPYESPGGTLYAVKVPASSTRTYWLEWRQPVGFDAALGTGITGGALVHTAYPSEWSCNACVLDMTPATPTSFGDAALPVGQTYTDATSGTTISVLARSATQLQVSVTTPTRPTYSDVPATHGAYSAIETLAWHGIAIECGTNPLRYCPDQAITRAEMAAFVERAKRGAGYAFTATGTRFADVPITHWAAKYIEQLYTDGVTSGCLASPLRYCPEAAITRSEMAPMLLRARWGTTFNPGTAAGTVFADVPRTHMFGAWIERLFGYGITLGCTATPRQYCPDYTVTRGQMAQFIQRTFALAAPPV